MNSKPTFHWPAMNSATNKTFFRTFVAGLLLSMCLNAAAVKTAIKDGVLSLDNGISRVEFRESDLAIMQFVNLESNCNYITEPGSGIFKLTMMVPGETPKNRWYAMPTGIPLKAEAFGRHSANAFGNEDAGGWELTFSQPDWQEGNLSVTVVISMTKDSPLFSWNISVDNHTNHAIQHLEFPILSGMGVDGAEATEYMAAPVYSGHKKYNIRKEMFYGLGYTEYPSGGMTLQLLTYEDGHDNAFYFAAHDCNNFRKTFAAEPSPSRKSFFESIIHYPEEPFANGSWKLNYPIVAGPFTGDWYDACKIYRNWATTQERWRKPLTDRNDIPKWLSETPVCFQGNEWSDSEKNLLAFTDEIISMQKALGQPMLFHWYLWQHNIRHDYLYPDYLPARAGFTEAVRKAQEAGIRVVPYLNIHLCETTLPIWKEFELYRHAKRDSSGKLWRAYGVCDNRAKTDDGSGPVDVFRAETAGRDMVPMCPDEPTWQKLIIGQAKGLVDDYKVDAIYWDETYCFAGLCYAKDHDHKWIGGPYHADGIAKIHQMTSALRPEGVPTFGENLGESYIDVCAAQLNGHSDGNCDSLPIFQTVYSDRTTEIGLFVNRKELNSVDVFASKLAFTLLRGRILGWFNSDQGTLSLQKTEYAQQLKLLQHYCRVRITGLPWLYYGEMLRKPDMSKLKKVNKIWSPWPTFTDTAFSFAIVEGAAYRAPDGRIGIVLANMTNETQHVEFPWNFKDWGGKPNQMAIQSQCHDGKWLAPTEIVLKENVSADLPPYEAIILSFGPFSTNGL